MNTASNLTSMKITPSGLPDTAKLTMTSAGGQTETYLIDQTALDMLVSGVMRYAGSNWKEHPETALKTVTGLAQALADKQTLSMQAVDESKCAISLHVGDVEMAFLVPNATGDEGEQAPKGLH